MTAEATAGSASAPDASGSGARPIRVIFVSSGNAARGQMAEALLQREGGDRFQVVSGGTRPRPLDPMTVVSLSRAGLDPAGAQSKSVMRFAKQPFDYVITVCDRARDSCPVFPSIGEQLHWGIEDPDETQGSDIVRQAAFDHALRELSGRIHAFVPLATPKLP